MDDRGLILEVSDTGVGISQEDLPRVMEKYIQASSEQNKFVQGTGLGIPVIKSLVELHGGTLELNSKVGVGTTITAIFPKERFVHMPGKLGNNKPRKAISNKS
jgi:two-component system cell cycle sensor histidine kinase PleC